MFSDDFVDLRAAVHSWKQEIIILFSVYLCPGAPLHIALVADMELK